jgi:SAM-dependent methyltransferase
VTTPFDYDADPERFRLAAAVTRRHLTAAGSLHEQLAALLVGIGARHILDIGCGEGALRAALPARSAARLVGLDASRTMLGAHPPPVVQAAAAALPFLAGAFDAAVAVDVLDHLADPAVAIGEAHRVLAPGGSFVAATASRRDSPELAHVWRPPPSSFDAEDGPGLVGSVFGQVQVRRWVRRWCGCPTATRSATTWWRGSCPPRPPSPPPRRSPPRRPSPSEAP